MPDDEPLPEQFVAIFQRFPDGCRVAPSAAAGSRHAAETGGGKIQPVQLTARRRLTATRHGNIDDVRIDVEPIPRLQRVGAIAFQAILRRIQEHAVPTLVFDMKRAVREGNHRVPARHFRVRQHPLTLLVATDDAASGGELAARGTERRGVRPRRLEDQDHGSSAVYRNERDLRSRPSPLQVSSNADSLYVVLATVATALGRRRSELPIPLIPFVTICGAPPRA